MEAVPLEEDALLNVEEELDGLLSMLANHSLEEYLRRSLVLRPLPEAGLGSLPLRSCQERLFHLKSPRLRDPKMLLFLFPVMTTGAAGTLKILLSSRHLG